MAHDVSEGKKEALPMKHNDLQLQELLKLARSCLKYEHLPGEPSEQDFFDRFSAEAEAEAKNLADLSQQQSTTSMLPDPLSLISGLEDFELLLSPPLETDGQPQPDPQTLKSQISQIESATAKVKKVLEDSNLELRAEILKRFRYEKELQASETEFQKLRRQKMLAMDMVKRQNNEIKELDRSIRELSAPPELPSSSRQASMCAAPSKPKTGRPRPASWKPASNFPDPSVVQCSVSSSGSGTVDATSSLALKSSVQTNSRLRSATPDASSIQLTDFEVQTGLSLRHLRKQYSSVLASKPKHIDAWKMYIP
jgi:hypothetical protein|eukprot:CAMPEP_0169124780 /NCGR_PEP_ID=MMETSP1015-20121227/34514_1 /TAXON_ID=342587 /ORGANISM="Karlodinium micrum, Strain CCMP2283" /LENGTH=309 /DNA_ID=CAMNT_0009188233 /DNA_START=57 /DNA_END=986 /DNA_ORIENTATION=+